MEGKFYRQLGRVDRESNIELFRIVSTFFCPSSTFYRMVCWRNGRPNGHDIGFVFSNWTDCHRIIDSSMRKLFSDNIRMVWHKI